VIHLSKLFMSLFYYVNYAFNYVSHWLAGTYLFEHVGRMVVLGGRLGPWLEKLPPPYKSPPYSADKTPLLGAVWGSRVEMLLAAPIAVWGPAKFLGHTGAQNNASAPFRA
jgi:hypothetical protein